jgi:hypothetical protein
MIFFLYRMFLRNRYSVLVCVILMAKEIRFNFGDCICSQTWDLPLKTHWFCGKELSGDSCMGDARYYCTKGNQMAVMRDLCMNVSNYDFCTPTQEEFACDFSKLSRKQACMAQRLCTTKRNSDAVMIKFYGKKSLLIK